MADCVITLLCPNDGLAMGLNISVASFAGPHDVPPFHTHVKVDSQVTCVNVLTAHTWKVTGDLLVEKVQ